MVTSALRKGNIAKASPPGSVPKAALHILADLLTPAMMTLWTNVEVQRTLPNGWQCSHPVWIPKPGEKNSTKLEDQREIHLVDDTAKAYFATINGAVMEKTYNHWTPAEYGGLPKRRTTYPIAFLDEMSRLARGQGPSFYRFAGDARKACNLMKRSKIILEVQKALGDTELISRWTDRFKRIVMHLHKGSANKKMLFHEGVIPGDPLGPAGFIFGFHGFLHPWTTAGTGRIMIKWLRP